MRWVLGVLGIASCGAYLADVKPLIETCKVVRVDYTRSGTYVVAGRKSGSGFEVERRIPYAGDDEALDEALDAAQSRCGEVPRLRE
jgi:hypothetical protein